MPVTLTLEGLLIGVPAAAATVAVTRWRWRPPSSRRARRRRQVGLGVLGVVVLLAWPLLLVLALIGGAFVVFLLLAGVTPAHRRTSPGERYWPRQAPTAEPAESGRPWFTAEDRERHLAEEIAEMARADDEQRRLAHGWDQYRWGHRSLPPGGPELF